MSADTTTGAGPRLEPYALGGTVGEVHSDAPGDDARPLHPEVGVIALPLDGWSSQWTSRQQVLTRLARYYHVLWLNPAPEWRDAWRRRAPAREQHVPGQPPSFVVRDAAVWHSTVYHPEWLVRSVVRARLRAARESLR
ncbi:MAG TPA: hypothetical protein VFS44_06115, partial [Gemmatimonadaceae bacterium]|nr:hypothetical protein [Gemmatimonadaceae bacterium]